MSNRVQDRIDHIQEKIDSGKASPEQLTSLEKTMKTPWSDLVEYQNLQAQQEVLRLAKQTGKWVFTGIHKENDWSRTAWWDSGWHLANRTGEYAVVAVKPSLEEEMLLREGDNDASYSAHPDVVARRAARKTVRKTGKSVSGLKGIR